MNRQTIYAAIEAERAYQDEKWGTDFDVANTPNDWVTYITKYLGQAVTMPWDGKRFREQMLKVAALAVAALEQEDYAPRHYDAAAQNEVAPRRVA
jgi:hypothetical protein